MAAEEKKNMNYPLCRHGKIQNIGYSNGQTWGKNLTIKRKYLQVSGLGWGRDDFTKEGFNYYLAGSK